MILIDFKWSNVYSWLKQVLKSSKHVLKLTLKVLKKCCFTFNSNSIIIKVTKQLYESIPVLFSQNLSKFQLFSPKEFFSHSSGHFNYGSVNGYNTGPRSPLYGRAPISKAKIGAKRGLLYIGNFHTPF